jgi:hypothetical protein
MPYSFAAYTESSVNALQFNTKNQEVIERKQEIVQSVSSHYGSAPSSILFYGFSPFILKSTCTDVYVTAINSQIKSFLDSKGIKYTYVPEETLNQLPKKFDWVVAGDEYFTFAKTEVEQVGKIKTVCRLAKDLVLTTLRDYKNQDFRDREFSQPLAIHSFEETKIFLEHHNYSSYDRNSWNTIVHEITGDKSIKSGPFPRRSMFFKQLAKFTSDEGAKSFLIHKNLMYKSLIKKNYEHVISISF